MLKERVHNEWFQTTVAGMCDCGAGKLFRKKHGLDVQVWIWGEYVIGRWRTVQKVCQHCFASKVLPKLKQHAHGCGCSFALQARSGYGPLAPWLRLPDHFHLCEKVG